MATKKTIAILGATGDPGAAIARRLASTSNRLLLMSEDAYELNSLKRNLIDNSKGNSEVTCLDCAKEASWEADIIIMATPYETLNNVAEKIRNVAVGKIVVSISSPLSNSCSGVLTALDSSAAEELQRLLPHSSVVRTFNTRFSEAFFTPIIDGKRADVLLAGNNVEALEEVRQILKIAGFSPVAVGDLSMSGALDQMQRIISKLGKSNYVWLAGWKASDYRKQTA